MSSERSSRTRTQTTFFEFDKEDTKNAANKAKQTNKAKPKKQEDHIAWFHKTLAPKFDDVNVPSWELVVELAAKNFPLTDMKITKDLDNLYKELVQATLTTNKHEELVIDWFHKMIAPKFDGECIPSWNLVLDLAERKFSLTKKVSDDLFVLYTELEEATLSNIEDIEIEEDNKIEKDFISSTKNNSDPDVLRYVSYTILQDVESKAYNGDVNEEPIDEMIELKNKMEKCSTMNELEEFSKENNCGVPLQYILKINNQEFNFGGHKIQQESMIPYSDKSIYGKKHSGYFSVFLPPIMFVNLEKREKYKFDLLALYPPLWSKKDEKLIFKKDKNNPYGSIGDCINFNTHGGPTWSHFNWEDEDDLRESYLSDIVNDCSDLSKLKFFIDLESCGEPYIRNNTDRLVFF